MSIPPILHLLCFCFFPEQNGNTINLPRLIATEGVNAKMPSSPPSMTSRALARRRFSLVSDASVRGSKRRAGTRGTGEQGANRPSVRLTEGIMIS